MTAHCFSIIGFLCGCRLFFSLSHCTDCLYTMNRISGFFVFIFGSRMTESLYETSLHTLEVKVQFSSGAQFCPTPCNPMDCRMPGFPVHHQLPGPTQTHWVVDAIQPSHPLSSPFPPTLNLSQHQGLFQKSVLRIRWPEYWSFSFSITPSNEYSELISFRIDCWISFQSKIFSRVFSNTTVQKH